MYCYIYIKDTIVLCIIKQFWLKKHKWHLLFKHQQYVLQLVTNHLPDLEYEKHGYKTDVGYYNGNIRVLCFASKTRYNKPLEYNEIRMPAGGLGTVVMLQSLNSRINSMGAILTCQNYEFFFHRS